MNILGRSHGDQILFYDPGYASLNVGDEIISDSARYFLEPLFENNFIVRLSTHQKTSFLYRRFMRDSKYGFVLGSNLLKSGMLFGFRQWDVSVFDSLQVSDLILVGCGWQQYERKTGLYSRLLYRRLLSDDYYHSVRDEYTRKKLAEIGINNVINTGCPTMWRFTEEFCESIPSKKGNDVVVTITDYRPDPKNDLKLFEQLFEMYQRVYVWLQGSRDHQYLRELGVLPKCSVVPSTLAAYDSFLEEHSSVDYVGTRLHGGIRALQHKKRTLLISIDNRAREMGSDFNLPILERDKIEMVKQTVSEEYNINIRINMEEIERFLSQFK